MTELVKILQQLERHRTVGRLCINQNRRIYLTSEHKATRAKGDVLTLARQLGNVSPGEGLHGIAYTISRCCMTKAVR
jgi:hypothetical protein